MKHRIEKASLLGAFALMLLLSACGSSEPEANAMPTRKETAANAAAAFAKARAQQHQRELVSGVTMGKPGAPVDLRFNIAARPAVGQALPITIELTPRAAISRLQVTVQGTDGIDLTAGTDIQPADRPPPDTAVVRSFTVTPKREGVFYIPVIAYVSDGGSSSSRSFAIPIIVGDAGAAVLAQKPATSVDAGNQRIERLPAQESTNSRR